MITLAGKFLTRPSPDRPGFWVYRQIDGNRVLEIELTQAEWQALRDASAAIEQAKLKELLNHPLNQWAAALLKKAGRPLNPRVLPVLQLAELALPEDDGQGDEAMAMDAWTHREANQALALKMLEKTAGPPENWGDDLKIEAETLLNELA